VSQRPSPWLDPRYENAPPLGFSRLSGDPAEIIGPYLPHVADEAFLLHSNVIIPPDRGAVAVPSRNLPRSTPLPGLMGGAFPGMTMVESWWLAILSLLFGALFLVGLVTDAQRSCDEKRRASGILPDKVNARRPLI
jgi:hypothetical protein